jgi:iron(III) transport system ATP-binding protein
MSNPKTLVLKAVSYTYEEQRGYVIDGLTLKMMQGERVAILGESGSGKSTLLGLLSGLLLPTRGQVLLAGEDIRQISFHKRNMALVLQRPPLLVGTTVQELLRRPAKRNQLAKGSDTVQVSEYKPKDIGEVLADLGMKDLERCRLTDLSGGELQRVHLARSLVWQPDFILLDEPFNSIDVQLKHSIYPIVRQHQAGCGSCMILVTHDPLEAMILCQRIVIIKNGSILADSSVDAILSTPPNIDSARLIGGFAMNVLDAKLTREGGLRFILDTFLGKYSGSVESGYSDVKIPVQAKAVFRWTDIIGQPISDVSLSQSTVFTVGNDGIGSPNNPVLYMHERSAIYGRPLSMPTRKVTLGLAAESALLYDSETENFVGRFIFSEPLTRGVA